MKRILKLFSSLVFCCLGWSSWAIAAGDISQPQLIEKKFSTSYIPDGFDSNDSVQMVAEGVFTNGCYKPGKVKVDIDENQKVIRLLPSAYLYSGLCIQVMVPYHQVLDLGMLKAGTYKVVQGDSAQEFGQLRVRLATQSAPDDFLYAPISQAYVSQRNQRIFLTLSGEFSNSCLKISKVIIDVQDKVIVAQPIAEMVKKDSCQEGSFNFEKSLELTGLNAGRYLLHVRSLNAKSVNNLFDIK